MVPCPGMKRKSQLTVTSGVSPDVTDVGVAVKVMSLGVGGADVAGTTGNR